MIKIKAKYTLYPDPSATGRKRVPKTLIKKGTEGYIIEDCPWKRGIYTCKFVGHEGHIEVPKDHVLVCVKQ